MISTHYKNLLRTCVQKSESLKYRELFENTKSPAYNLWKQLGPVINNKKKKKHGNLITKIIKDDVNVSDAMGIANSLIPYFCETGQELQSEFPNTDQSFTKYLPASTTEICFLNRSLPMKLNWKCLNQTRQNQRVMIIENQE